MRPTNGFHGRFGADLQKFLLIIIHRLVYDSTASWTYSYEVESKSRNDFVNSTFLVLTSSLSHLDWMVGGAFGVGLQGE
jgi:hypothetical protein